MNKTVVKGNQSELADEVCCHQDSCCNQESWNRQSHCDIILWILDIKDEWKAYSGLSALLISFFLDLKPFTSVLKICVEMVTWTSWIKLYGSIEILMRKPKLTCHHVTSMLHLYIKAASLMHLQSHIIPNTVCSKGVETELLLYPHVLHFESRVMNHLYMDIRSLLE